MGYNFLLSLGLVFLSYQNAKIQTHFIQEGEFTARVVFVIFLVLVPSFVIKTLLLLTSDNRIEIFWFGLFFIVSFPTIILGGLFIPKVSLYSYVLNNVLTILLTSTNLMIFFKNSSYWCIKIRKNLEDKTHCAKWMFIIKSSWNWLPLWGQS